MEISIHLRGGRSLTDHRALALAKGLSYLPHTVVLRARHEEPPARVDLIVQANFASTVALEYALEHRIPYLIMEGPIFRDMYDLNTVSDFTYNGLQAGGTRPKPGIEPRPHPKLLPMHDGPTLLLGQKPTDMSLRGADHIQWIQEKQTEYPNATFRHNPIMVPPNYNEPLKQVLTRIGRTISHTSTASVESVFSGCETICDHPANEAYSVNGDREEWAHRLSWAQFLHTELESDDVAAYILTGYDEAAENARLSRVEIPRPKVDGKGMMGAYYAAFPYEAEGETLIETQRRLAC